MLATEPAIETGKRPISALSIESKMLYERLKESAIGDIIEYSELSTLVGRDVQGSARGVMYTARKMALSVNDMVFDTVVKVGIKRLSDIEIVNTGERTVTHVRRMSTRALRRITCIQSYDTLPNDSKVKHNTYASVFGALSAAMRADKMKKLSSRIAQAQAALPLAKTLEAFRD